MEFLFKLDKKYRGTFVKNSPYKVGIWYPCNISNDEYARYLSGNLAVIYAEGECFVISKFGVKENLSCTLIKKVGGKK